MKSKSQPQSQPKLGMFSKGLSSVSIIIFQQIPPTLWGIYRIFRLDSRYPTETFPIHLDHRILRDRHRCPVSDLHDVRMTYTVRASYVYHIKLQIVCGTVRTSPDVVLHVELARPHSIKVRYLRRNLSRYIHPVSRFTSSHHGRPGIIGPYIIHVCNPIPYSTNVWNEVPMASCDIFRIVFSAAL